MARRAGSGRPGPAGPARPARGRLWPWVLLLVAVSLLLYGRTVGFGYVRADDTDLVRDNQALLGDLANAPAAFGQSYFAVAGQVDPKAYYRPLVVVSFMLDARIGGAGPGIYHATNIGLHVVAVLLLMTLLRRMGAGTTAAGVTALLFAVHPANVQAVAWVVGRNDSLMTIFGLLSLLALLRWLERPGPLVAVAHLGGLAFALFTKETAVLMVPLFGLVVWRRTGSFTWFRRHWRMMVGYGVVTGVWFAVRSGVLAGASSAGLGLLDYAGVVIGNLPQLVLYAGKALLPIRPSVMPGVDLPGLLLGGLALAVLAYGLARWIERRSAALVGGWLLLFLLPVLVIPGLPAYEHRLYFPLVGLAAGVAEIATRRRWRLRARSTLGPLVAAVLVLFAVSYRQVSVFAGPLAFWGSATSGTPYAPIALVNLGRIVEERGRPTQAERYYWEALDLDPATPKASNNLGTILARRGQYEEARRLFEREIANHPANHEALFNLGLYYKVSGAPERAVVYWERAVEANPRFRPAYEELIAHFAARGDAGRVADYRARLAGIDGESAR